MKKKLLIATDSFLPRWDGIARFLLEIIPSLKDDFEVTIIAPNFPGEMKNLKDVNIVRVPLSFIRAGDFVFSKLKFRLIKKVVKENDIVWSNTIGPIGCLAIHYAKKKGVPLVSYVHSIEWELVSKSISRPYLSYMLTNITKILARRLYNKSNLILLPSKDVRNIFDSARILPRKKVVYLGTDTNKFVPPDDRESAKQRLGIDKDIVVIGFHGRLGREKGLMTLYNSFIKLRSEYDKILLVIIGSGLKEQENLFRSTADIKYIESTDNVVPYLQAMDIYVLPSFTETTSLSTLEAMSCECAVLSTKVGFVKKYIKDKYNGSFFPMGNEEVLRLKLKWLIEHPDIRKELGKNARKVVKRKFNWNDTKRDIRSALLSLL